MKKSVALISTLTVLILLLLMVPIVIPQDAVSAAVADNVTLNSLRNEASCNTTYISVVSVKSGGSVTCNLTVGGDATGWVNTKLQLYAPGASVYTKEIFAAYPTQITAAGYSIIYPLYNMPAVSDLAANSYDVVAYVQPNPPPSGGGWVYSGKLSSAITVNNTGPTLGPTLVTPLAGCVNTATPTFAWNTVTGAATYTVVIDGTDNMTCLLTNSWTASPAMTQASHTWSVKAVDAAGNATQSMETRAICIDAATPSDPNPLLTPLDSSTVAGGYNPTYTWTRSTDTSTCANIQYVVETYSNATPSAAYLVDNATMAQPVAGNPSYTPTALTSSATGEYWWRVRAYDCVGRTSGWATTFKFTKPVTVTTISIPISTGWNLISLPLTPTTSTISSVIYDSIKPSIASVFYLNGNTGWQWYEPNRATQVGGLTTMEAGKSYWVNGISSCTLTITGTPCPVASTGGAPPTIPQYTYTTNNFDNWNMLGFKCTQNKLVGTAIGSGGYLSSLIGKYSDLYRYAAGWVPVSTTDNMTPGTGYLIQMTGTGYVVPPCY